MQFLTAQESSNWLAGHNSVDPMCARRIRVSDFSTESVPSSVLYCLAQHAPHWLRESTPEQLLLWICAFGVGYAQQPLYLYHLVRHASFSSATANEEPGHLFARHEDPAGAAVLFLLLSNQSEVTLSGSTSQRALFFDNDGIVYWVAESDAAGEKFSASLPRKH